MMGLALFLGAVVGALGLWAVLCAVVLRATGREVTLQLGLGPAAAAWQARGIALRLGVLPLGAWVRAEPSGDADGGIGAAVHAGIAVGAGIALWLAGGVPPAVTEWLATVLRFGHPETGGVLRTVLHVSHRMVLEPARTVALVVFVLAAWNTLHGTLVWLARDRAALLLATTLAPLPWLLWLLWLDVAG